MNFDDNKTLLTVLFIATFGGLINFLRYEEKYKLSRLIIILLTASFSGLITYYVTSGLGLSIQFQCAISGVAGYSGGTFLDELILRLRKIFLKCLQ